MESITKTLEYFFSYSPGEIFSYFIPLIIFTAIIFGFSIFLFIAVKKQRKNKAFKKNFRYFPVRFLILSILLGIYTFFRSNYVAFLSMRFFLYLLIIITLYFLFLFIHKYIYKYPAEKKKYEQREEKNKYPIGKKYK